MDFRSHFPTGCRGGTAHLAPADTTQSYLCKPLFASDGVALTVTHMSESAPLTTALLPLQLRLARNAARLSQQDLADRLGVTRQMVSHLESSGADIQLSTLSRWAHALNLAVTLTAPRTTFLLTAADGTLATANRLAMHAAVDGPDRNRAVTALANCRPGARIAQFGPSPGAELVHAHETLTAHDLEHLPQRLSQAAHAPLDTPGPHWVLLLDLDAADGNHHGTAQAVLARARSAGWVVIAHSRKPIDTPTLTRNTAYRLHAANGTVTDMDGTAWTITPVTLSP